MLRKPWGCAIRNFDVFAMRRHARSAVGIGLLVFPHGGQFASRRNVRESMVADQLRARARQDAAEALRNSERDHRWLDAR